MFKQDQTSLFPPALLSSFLQAPTEVKRGHNVEAAILLRFLLALFGQMPARHGLLSRPAARRHRPTIRLIIHRRPPARRMPMTVFFRRRRMTMTLLFRRCRRPCVHRFLADDGQIVPADERREDVLAGRLKDGPLTSVLTDRWR